MDIYTHVSKKSMSKTRNPLENLDLQRKEENKVNICGTIRLGRIQATEINLKYQLLGYSGVI